MPIIEWKSSFAIGIPVIDEQHRNLVCRVARLYEEWQKPEALDLSLADEVSRYASFHLKYEEGFMESIHYPSLEEHRSLHHKLILTVDHFLNEVKSQKTMLSSSLIEEILLEHLCRRDRAIALHYHSLSGKNKALQAVQPKPR